MIDRFSLFEFQKTRPGVLKQKWPDPITSHFLLFLIPISQSSNLHKYNPSCDCTPYPTHIHSYIAYGSLVPSTPLHIHTVRTQRPTRPRYPAPMGRSGPFPPAQPIFFRRGISPRARVVRGGSGVYPQAQKAEWSLFSCSFKQGCQGWPSRLRTWGGWCRGHG
jgi:hypothetical protein